MPQTSIGGHMCNCGEAELDRLAGEILRYLQTHSAASDTTEGIAQWWVKRQRLEDTLVRVQSALDKLVSDAMVDARQSRAGQTLYFLRRRDRAGADAGTGSGG